MNDGLGCAAGVNDDGIFGRMGTTPLSRFGFYILSLSSMGALFL
jgi:hypothetical protein